MIPLAYGVVALGVLVGLFLTWTWLAGQRRSGVWWVGLAAVWSVCLGLPVVALALVSSGGRAEAPVASVVGAGLVLMLPVTWSVAAYVSWRDLLGNERPDETTKWRKSCEL